QAAAGQHAQDPVRPDRPAGAARWPQTHGRRGGPRGHRARQQCCRGLRGTDLPGGRPVARGLPPLRERRRPRPGPTQRRLAYDGLIGIKNGYTSHAGNTLVAAARRGGRTLVVTVMNPQSGGGFAVYEEARRLLDWGFGAAGRVDPVGSLDALRARPRPGPDAV